MMRVFDLFVDYLGSSFSLAFDFFSRSGALPLWRSMIMFTLLFLAVFVSLVWRR